jgi:hypothetical protein
MVSVFPQVEPGGHLPGDGGEGAYPRHGDLAPQADALRHFRHWHSPDRPRHVLGQVHPTLPTTVHYIAMSVPQHSHTYLASGLGNGSVTFWYGSGSVPLTNESGSNSRSDSFL